MMIDRRQLLMAGAASLARPSSLAWSQSTGEAITPFTFHAEDAALTDLRRRLDGIRWPERETGSGWDQGPPLGAMQALVAHWRSAYDWRKCESELAGWPQFKTMLDGLGIHFIHVRSRHADACRSSSPMAGRAPSCCSAMSLRR
jgi:hypothetical protein